MKVFLHLIRPHQWFKNLFIFLPLFFDHQLGNLSNLMDAGITFVAFCALASSIYCLNDIRDIESDRLHPEKCKRPLASGKVSKNMGFLFMGLLALMAFFVLFLLPSPERERVFLLLLFYYVLNVAYCFWLKYIAIFDVFVIASGFVIRILIGGMATGVWISHWIVLMTFLLALFLAFAKRRDDVVIYEGTGIKPRKIVDRYNLQFLNQTIAIIASVTIVCYIMYTTSTEVIARMGSDYLYSTSFWVLLGMLRYLQITLVDLKSGSPTQILLKDRIIQVCILGWLLSFFIIIYL